MRHLVCAYVPSVLLWVGRRVPRVDLVLAELDALWVASGSVLAVGRRLRRRSVQHVLRDERTARSDTCAEWTHARALKCIVRRRASDTRTACTCTHNIPATTSTCTLYPASCTLHPLPYTVYHVSSTWYPVPYTLYTLYPVPYTLYAVLSTPCGLYPIHYVTIQCTS